jgi:transcription elongation factor Elf1
MPYIFLKNILESVIANYLCPDCGSKTSAEQLNITGMSSRGIDIHLVCSVCGIHSQLSAEVNTMASELLTSENGHKFFEEFIKNGGNIDAKMINKKNPNAKGINAADIAKIDADIQNAKSIEDLMKE